jgi:ribosomal protein S18 acetylase RimI-like enzyme
MEIRQMNKHEVIYYEKELTELLCIVLTENIIQEVLFEHAQKYYMDLRRFSEDGSAVIIGAFEGEELIGFHWGYEVNIFNERRMHSYLNAIKKEYRGQKIGSKFFRKLEEITREYGISIIEAMVTYSNQNAVKYHFSNGFEIERIKVWKHLHSEQGRE